MRHLLLQLFWPFIFIFLGAMFVATIRAETMVEQKVLCEAKSGGSNWKH